MTTIAMVRDVCVLKICGGTSDIQRIVIRRAIAEERESPLISTRASIDSRCFIELLAECDEL